MRKGGYLHRHDGTDVQVAPYSIEVRQVEHQRKGAVVGSLWVGIAPALNAAVHGMLFAGDDLRDVILPGTRR
jgi:hypothetical protein